MTRHIGTHGITYQRQIKQAGHTRRYEITKRGGEWQARALLDAKIMTEARYDDWHRVERARLRFDLEVGSLEDAGWIPD